MDCPCTYSLTFSFTESSSQVGRTRILFHSPSKDSTAEHNGTDHLSKDNGEEEGEGRRSKGDEPSLQKGVSSLVGQRGNVFGRYGELINSASGRPPSTHCLAGDMQLISCHRSLAVGLPAQGSCYSENLSVARCGTHERGVRESLSGLLLSG